MALERRDNDALKSDPDRNPDPITGAPGSHPIGTGVGAAGGGAAGAAIGAAVSGPAFPVGAAVGAVVGAIAGGLAGKGAAEAVNPTAEDEYWRTNHASRPYYESSYTYDEDYRPAYEYGWTARSQLGANKFEDVEKHLGRGWDQAKAKSRLGWEKAKLAARDAFHRTDEAGSAYPGHSSSAAAASSALDIDDFASSCSTRYAGRNFDDVENDLRRDWNTRHPGEGTWDKVKDSVRSAWHKVERAIPGDADRDGR
jgi:hypothetical protein